MISTHYKTTLSHHDADKLAIGPRLRQAALNVAYRRFQVREEQGCEKQGRQGKGKGKELKVVS